MRVHLDVGRTWHRVTRTTDDDERFEVSTPVAVATVRGTVFAVSCTPDRTCTFVVFEGTVDIATIAGESATLEAGQFVVVGPDGRIGPVTGAPDLSDNPWVQRNTRLDEGADPDEVLAVSPPGNLAGAWNVEFRITESVNVFDESVGDTIRQRWSVTQTCDDGACAFEVTILEVDPPGDEPPGNDTRTYRYEHGEFVRESFFPAECVDGESGDLLLQHGYDSAQASALRPTGDAGTTDELRGSSRITGFPNDAGQRSACSPSRTVAEVVATRG